jgi:hypothetical protein
MTVRLALDLGIIFQNHPLGKEFRVTQGLCNHMAIRGW